MGDGRTQANRTGAWRRVARWVAAGIGVASIGLGGVLLARTFAAPHQHPPAPGPVAELALDEDAAARRLAGALRFATVSSERGYDDAPFDELNAYLDASFPGVRDGLERTVVARHSRLYTWRGRSDERPPAIFMAHLDVVPVEPGTEREWSHPPFAGDVADGYVWGRGAMDFKVGVTALLEAVELLLAEGYRPSRTIYLAFGHDEEVGGSGAAAIAELLESRGVRAEMVLDEGHMITRGLLAAVPHPVAVIGVTEKGYLTLELTARSEGGHSSTPPRPTAVGRLARAIHRLEEHRFASSIGGPVSDMLETVGPHTPFGTRVVMANLWLLGPIVRRQLGSQRGTNALIRTTVAPTTLEGSPRENVLAQTARGRVNLRILPGERVQGVIDRVRRVVDDPSIEIARSGSLFTGEPSPISSSSSPAYRAIERSVREVFREPAPVVAPSVFVGATDARRFTGLARDVYRFCPQVMTPDDLARLHGTDERQSVAGYADVVRFYAQLIRNLDAR